MDGIGQLLQSLRETRQREARRNAPEAPYTPLGPNAWKRRRKKAEAKRKAEEERKYNAKHSKALANSRYYRKNKSKLNRARAIAARRPMETYKRSERRAKNKGQTWDLTFNEWWDLWTGAGKVRSEDTGFLIDAWDARGSNPATCTQMQRRNLNGPWSRSNCFIGYKGRELSYGDDKESR